MWWTAKQVVNGVYVTLKANSSCAFHVHGPSGGDLIAAERPGSVQKRPQRTHSWPKRPRRLTLSLASDSEMLWLILALPSETALFSRSSSGKVTFNSVELQRILTSCIDIYVNSLYSWLIHFPCVFFLSFFVSFPAFNFTLHFRATEVVLRQRNYVLYYRNYAEWRL